jgi:hypothetical protein
MLTPSAHRQLAELVAGVYQLLDDVHAQADKAVVTQHVAETRRQLDDLAEAVKPTSGRSFASLDRHLYWLQRFYLEEKPDRYAADIRDIRSSDLPGVIKAIEAQHSGPLHDDLLTAIGSAWDARQYAGAIRDAFIYLENAIRDVGRVDPSRGLSGERLVATVLDPSKDTHVNLTQDTFLGSLTGGEVVGFFYLIRGAFLLFRNSTAHRSIDVTAGEAEDVLRLVNLCLRFLPGSQAADDNSAPQGQN